MLGIAPESPASGARFVGRVYWKQNLLVQHIETSLVYGSIGFFQINS